jgi:hypothetical protein
LISWVLRFIFLKYAKKRIITAMITNPYII